MKIDYTDGNYCSINFEADDLVEKDILREIYLKMISAKHSERRAMLQKMLE